MALEYNAVLEAIGNYYGTGSDQWVEFAKYGIASDNLVDTLSQVPGVNIYTNNAGKITGLTVDKAFSGASAGIAGDLNSNVQIPTQGSGTTFKSGIPANGGYNSQTGTAELTSGAKAAGTGTTVATVMDKISLAIAGVSLGAKLGAWIDRNLYEANPNWWDEHFPTINPATWDSIAKTEGGKNFLNSLFGISELDGKKTGTMYLDEDAVAYLAYAMKESGFFGVGDSKVISYDGAMGSLNFPNTYPPLPFGAAGNTFITPAEYDESYTRECEIMSGSPAYMVAILSPTGYLADYPVYIGTETFRARYKRRRDGTWNYLNGSAVTINGNTYYVSPIPTTFTHLLTNISATNMPTPLQLPAIGAVSREDLVRLLYGGVIEQPSTVDGVDKQPGATYPDTSGWNDPATTKAALKSANPDWWNNALTNDVPQTDGSVATHTYIPVPITGTTGSDDAQPTNTTVTQTDTGTVTDTSTTDLINTLIRYITRTDSETPTDTPTPPDTPNPTDTGDGSTPPVVAPTGQASALFAVYNPTQAALNSFGAWLWSSNFIDQVLKLFNNPMQSIIGLHKIFAAPPIGGSANIRVGYLDSGVGANLVSGQYVTIDCGTVRVREQFGNVFDYTDTDIRLYLPFIGVVPLSTSDVMRGNVNVVYHVDVITGACLAEVKITRDGGGGTLYQYAGDAAVRYPISSGSYMGVVSGVLGVVGGIASAVMSGGATAPLVGGAVASGVSRAKTDVQHSGSFAGNAGAMGGKKPYLIIERPQTAIAAGYSAYQGTGANTVKTVGSMSGYFRMSDVHVDSVTGASTGELEQIRTAIEQGVIQ